MIKAVWQGIAFGGVDTAKGIALDPGAVSPNDSDTGCCQARIYTDDCYHPEFKSHSKVAFNLDP